MDKTGQTGTGHGTGTRQTGLITHTPRIVCVHSLNSSLFWVWLVGFCCVYRTGFTWFAASGGCWRRVRIFVATAAHFLLQRYALRVARAYRTRGRLRAACARDTAHALPTPPSTIAVGAWRRRRSFATRTAAYARAPSLTALARAWRAQAALAQAWRAPAYLPHHCLPHRHFHHGTAAACRACYARRARRCAPATACQTHARTLGRRTHWRTRDAAADGMVCLSILSPCCGCAIFGACMDDRRTWTWKVPGGHGRATGENRWRRTGRRAGRTGMAACCHAFSDRRHGGGRRAAKGKATSTNVCWLPRRCCPCC